MILFQNRRLHFKKIFRILDMCLQRLRHILKILEKTSEDPVVAGGDGILGISQIEIHLSGIGIHGDLHGISNIIDSIEGSCIGVLVRYGIGIDHPVHFAVRHDQIGI